MQKYKFYLSQPVLVRMYDSHIWQLGAFSKYVENNTYPFYTANAIPVIENNINSYRSTWKQCIPYEGNERLLGTRYDLNNDIDWSIKPNKKETFIDTKNTRFKYGELVKLFYDYDDICGTVATNAIYIAPMPNQEGYHIVIRVGTKDYVPEVTNRIEKGKGSMHDVLK